mgnify:CR=1 FL=1
MMLLSVTNVAFGEVNAKDFSAKNPPHLPPANVAQFEDGRDYFSYQEPIEQAKRSDRKIPIQFFFETLTFSFYVLIITKVSYDLTSVKR